MHWAFFCLYNSCLSCGELDCVGDPWEVSEGVSGDFLFLVDVLLEVGGDGGGSWIGVGGDEGCSEVIEVVC